MADNSTPRPWQKGGPSPNPQGGRIKGSYTTDSSTALERAKRAALKHVMAEAKAGNLTAIDILLRHVP